MEVLNKKDKKTDEEKEVHKGFKRLQEFASDMPRNELWMIYEFCDYHLFQTQLVVNNTKRNHIKKLLKDIVSYRKVAHEYVSGILNSHKDELKTWELAQKEEERIREAAELARLAEEEAQKHIEPGVITKISEGFIIDILVYLDCRSLVSFSLTSRYFRQLIFSDKATFLFKPFCLVLYKEIPSLPLHTVFWSLEDCVAEKPEHFSPEIRALIARDVRKVAWGCALIEKPLQDHFKTSKKYFKQFENYFRMMMEAPRVHFGGYYVLKERYTKIGEKSLNHLFTPLIEVTYYRYFRFLPDGRFLFLLLNKKIKPDVISKRLSIQSFENHEGEQDQLVAMGLPGQENGNHIGEYVMQQDTVRLRFNSGSTVFGYDLKVASTSYGAHDRLVITNYQMSQIQLEHTYTLYSAKVDESSKLFHYKPLESLRLDLPNSAAKRMTL